MLSSSFPLFHFQSVNCVGGLIKTKVTAPDKTFICLLEKISSVVFDNVI